MAHVVPAAAQQFAEQVRQRLGPRAAQLCVFGSYARGEANDESDLDVLVVVHDLTRSEKLELLDLATEAGLKAGVALHALAMSHSEHEELWQRELRLVRDIAREGVPLWPWRTAACTWLRSRARSRAAAARALS